MNDDERLILKPKIIFACIIANEKYIKFIDKLRESDLQINIKKERKILK